MYKILVVNPNTSEHSSETIRTTLLPYVHEGLKINVVNPPHGPEGIDTLLDIAIAGIETAKLIVKYSQDYDGFVIACGADPGVDIARQVTNKPVVGIAEAGMSLACMLGSKFSLLTGLPAEIPILYELVSKYGFEKRLASIIPVHMDTLAITHNADTLLKNNLIAGHKAVKEDLAEVLVLSGSVVAKLAKPLQIELGIPVVSGIVAGLKICEDLIEMGLHTSQIYKYFSIPQKDRFKGYEVFSS